MMTFCLLKQAQVDPCRVLHRVLIKSNGLSDSALCWKVNCVFFFLQRVWGIKATQHPFFFTINIFLFLQKFDLSHEQSMKSYENVLDHCLRCWGSHKFWIWSFASKPQFCWQSTIFEQNMVVGFDHQTTSPWIWNTVNFWVPTGRRSPTNLAQVTKLQNRNCSSKFCTRAQSRLYFSIWK